jgi:hypothetical protein
MPSLTSLLLRYVLVFVLWLLLAFGGLIGLSTLTENGFEGPWGFLAMLVIALLAAAQSVGRQMGRAAGRFPSEGVAWRFAILVSVLLLLAFFLLLIQAERSGISADLPGPQDEGWSDFMLRSCAVFLPVAAILTRFGIFTGAAAGLGGRRAPAHAAPQPMPASFFDPSGGRGASRAPGVVAMVGRLMLLNILGAILMIVAGVALAVAGYGFDPTAGWPSTLVSVLATFLAGHYYGKRAGRAMSQDFAWAVSGLYMLVSVGVTGVALAVLLTQAAIPLPADINGTAVAVVLGITAVILLVFTFITKALLRVGANAGLKSARMG